MYRKVIPRAECATQVERQLKLHPQHVPLVLEPDTHFFSRLSSKDREPAHEFLSKRRYAPPRKWTVAEFMQVIRCKICLPSQYAMFLFVSKELEDNVLVCCSQTMGEVYDEHRDPSTGMLWMTAVLESTFG